MRIVNQHFSGLAKASTLALSGYFTDKSEASFDDVRRDVPSLAALSDSELREVANEAGFRVET